MSNPYRLAPADPVETGWLQSLFSVLKCGLGQHDFNLVEASVSDNAMAGDTFTYECSRCGERAWEAD